MVKISLMRVSISCRSDLYSSRWNWNCSVVRVGPPCPCDPDVDGDIYLSSPSFGPVSVPQTLRFPSNWAFLTPSRCRTNSGPLSNSDIAPYMVTIRRPPHAAPVEVLDDPQRFIEPAGLALRLDACWSKCRRYRPTIRCWLKSP